MIERAIKYLKESLIRPNERLIEINEQEVDRKFFVDDEGVAREVEELNKLALSSLKVSTLTSLIEYIKSEEQRTIREGYLHVVDEKTVKLVSKLDPNGRRESLIVANAIVPRFEYERYHDAEELIISLQSKFTRVAKGDDRELLLKVIGNVKEENVRATGDDGMSQAVTIRTGVSNVEGVKVPNPVALAPYRTFLEVQQPESDFVFRMKDGPRAAIFEADGGAWRNKAISNVRDYLTENLSDEIESGRITIIA